jgi:hypothetical protein
MKCSPPYRRCPRNPDISQRYNSCRLTVHPRASIYPFHTARSPSLRRWPWSPGTFRNYNVCKMIRMRSPELWSISRHYKHRNRLTTTHSQHRSLPHKKSRPMSSCIGRTVPLHSPDMSTPRESQKIYQRHKRNTEMPPHSQQICRPCKWSRPMSSRLGRTGPWDSSDTSTRS